MEADVVNRAYEAMDATRPLISFLIGVGFTVIVIAFDFDPDRNLAPVLWMILPGLFVVLFHLRPAPLSAIACIASFPVVLFGHLALADRLGNMWPIGMVIHTTIVAVLFSLGFGIGIAMKALARK